MRTYRASELGSCIRAQAAIQLGYSPLPTPAWLQTAYDRGIAHEAECVDAMRADGWLIDREQHLVTMSISDEVQIEGHLDGAGLPHSDVVLRSGRVVEIKSPGAWAKFRDASLRADWSDPLAHRYGYQISVYQIVMGMEAVIACVEEGQVRTFGIEIPPFTEDQIRDRVAEIERWVGTGGIPPTCSQDDGQGCPVAYLHEQEERVVLDNPALAGWLRRHLAAQAEAALLSEERKQFEFPPGRYECDGVNVTVAVTKGRTTYDTKQAVADGVDLSAYVKTGKAGVRWDIESA